MDQVSSWLFLIPQEFVNKRFKDILCNGHFDQSSQYFRKEIVKFEVFGNVTKVHGLKYCVVQLYPPPRDEDRAILIELKRKGASRDTFSGLSEKLNKPSEQVSLSLYLCSACDEGACNNRLFSFLSPDRSQIQPAHEAF